MTYKIYYRIAACLVFFTAYSLPPINLFRPSDKFMIPPKNWCGSFQWTFAYEGALKIVGVQEDLFDTKSWSGRRVNPLQLYQCEQNAIAMLKGFGPLTGAGQLGQQFFEDDDNHTHGLFTPCGKFSVPVNAMFSARWHFNHAISLALHIQYLEMQLKNVRFTEKNNRTSFEDLLVPQFLRVAEEVGDIYLGPWKRHGFGDMVIQAYWQDNFPQYYRPWLRNVAPMVRFGVDIPTGKRADEDMLLAIPFGNDGSWGVQLAGGLDLYFGSNIKAGFDIELLYLFGHTRTRRFRDDLSQTDLFFLKRLPAFKENGLTQQYYLYAKMYDCYGWGLGVHFQHLKQNESRLYVCSDKYDPLIINEAENLQDWTTNSFIFTLDYDCNYWYPNSAYTPTFSLWYKQGMMGERALLANTLGASFTINF